jgi:hypothetical protein
MSKKKVNVLILLFIGLPIFLFLLYSYTVSSDLFFADDFHLLKTVVWVQESSSFFEIVALFFQQHNEHRIIVPRLLTFLDYYLEGHINWRTLILLGNIIWAANIWFFWKVFKYFQLPIWMFIAVPFIFLNPLYYDNISWTISILQQSVIIFWFTLLCYLGARENYKLALIVAVIATFTHGNGIFSFLIGIVFALMDRNWSVVIKWSIVWVLIGVLYFWGFEKGQAAGYAESLSEPVRLIRSFFAFFGSLTLVKFDNFYFPVILGGGLVLVLVLYLLPKFKIVLKQEKSIDWADKMLFGVWIFLGITALLISVSRSWGGIENILAPRYMHYSPYITCWVYIIILQYFGFKTARILAIIALPIVLLFNFLTYFETNEMIQYRKNWLTADKSNWSNHQVMLNYEKSFNLNIQETYNDALRAGICNPVTTLPMVKPGEGTDNHNLSFEVYSVLKSEASLDKKFKKNYLNLKENTI